MKRFTLTVYAGKELEEVIEGLENINSYIRPILDNPPVEVNYEIENEEDLYDLNEEGFEYE